MKGSPTSITSATSQVSFAESISSMTSDTILICRSEREKNRDSPTKKQAPIFFQKFQTQTGRNIRNFVLKATKKSDPATATHSLLGQFLLLLKRSFSQSYQNVTVILLEYLMHFVIGVLVSLGMSGTVILGAPPEELCMTQAYILHYICNEMDESFK